MDLISVVIPVCNEEEALAEVLDQVVKTMDESGYPYEVIVVDDGSTDASAQIVRQSNRVKLIQHPYNRGPGAARTTGLRAARGDVVVMTDGDGTYPIRDIPRLLEYMDEYDMVVGARKGEAGSFRLLRSPTKLFIRLLASYLTGMNIPDLNSGFRAFKREPAMKFTNLLPMTHSWVGTITIAFLSEGYTVKYVPIGYYKRKGRSSFHPFIDTYNYISLLLRTVAYFDPLKIFLPLSFGLAFVGGLKMIYDIFTYNFHFAPSTVIIVLSAMQMGAIGLLADLIVRRYKQGR